MRSSGGGNKFEQQMNVKWDDSVFSSCGNAGIYNGVSGGRGETQHLRRR